MEKPTDLCPKCSHERRYHFAADDGDNRTDFWCEHGECGCDEAFGNTPGFQDVDGIH